MRNQTKKINKNSCIGCVHKTAQAIVNLYGLPKIQTITHDEFYGYMLQFSPTKPHEFNYRTIERSLRTVSATYRSLEKHLANKATV